MGEIYEHSAYSWSLTDTNMCTCTHSQKRCQDKHSVTHDLQVASQQVMIHAVVPVSGDIRIYVVIYISYNTIEICSVIAMMYTVSYG